jgi:hypothetical protein
VRKTLGFTAAVATLAAAASVLGLHAFAGGGKTNVEADVLTGYQESVNGPIASAGTGTFEASIDDEAQTISYTLTYSGLTAPATVAHIHFGNRAQNGGVVAFLCGGGGQAPCPAGTGSEATVTGTIAPGNVVGPASQGIGPGDFQKLVDALRAGVAYANVHDATFPTGEIRGQINDDDQRQP